MMINISAVKLGLLNINEWKYDYYRGISTAEMAIKYDAHQNTFVGYLNRLRLPKRPRNFNSPIARQKWLNDPEIIKMRNKYATPPI